jgi:hypothetical protein
MEEQKSSKESASGYIKNLISMKNSNLASNSETNQPQNQGNGDNLKNRLEDAFSDLEALRKAIKDIKSTTGASASVNINSGVSRAQILSTEPEEIQSNQHFQEDVTNNFNRNVYFSPQPTSLGRGGNRERDNKTPTGVRSSQISSGLSTPGNGEGREMQQQQQGYNSRSKHI